jgi:hypothetical protein
LSWNKSYSSVLTEYTFVFLINLTAMGRAYAERGSCPFVGIAHLFGQRLRRSVKGGVSQPPDKSGGLFTGKSCGLVKYIEKANSTSKKELTRFCMISC